MDLPNGNFEQIVTSNKVRCPLQLIELAAEGGLQSHVLCQDDRTVSSAASGGQRQPHRSLGFGWLWAQKCREKIPLVPFRLVPSHQNQPQNQPGFPQSFSVFKWPNPPKQIWARQLPGSCFARHAPSSLFLLRWNQAASLGSSSPLCAEKPPWDTAYCKRFLEHFKTKKSAERNRQRPFKDDAVWSLFWLTPLKVTNSLAS